MRKALYILTILSLASIYSCKKDKPLRDIPPKLTSQDSLLKVAGVNREGFTDLEGPVSDSQGRLYLYGLKDGSAWFGVFKSDKMIFSKSFKDDPTTGNIEYGETANVGSIEIFPLFQTNDAIIFHRKLKIKGSINSLYDGQTIYNKKDNSARDYLYATFPSNGFTNPEFPIIRTYINWYNDALLVNYNDKIFLMNSSFEVSETLDRPDGVFEKGEVLLPINKYDFISYIQESNDVYVRSQNLKKIDYKWQIKLFTDLADQFRIDTIYGSVDNSQLSINMNITNKDGSKQDLKKSVNLETGEEIK